MTTAQPQSDVILLDETDVRKRLIQHGSILTGIVLLASAAPQADQHRMIAWVLMAGGLALLLLAAFVLQRGDLRYKDHRILFVNNPLRGESLYVDGVRVARGKLGRHTELRAALASGETLVVVADAGLIRYRCRIFVRPAPSALSDEQLLAEVRRRGIQA